MLCCSPVQRVGLSCCFDRLFFYSVVFTSPPITLCPLCHEAVFCYDCCRAKQYVELPHNLMVFESKRAVCNLSRQRTPASPPDFPRFGAVSAHKLFVNEKKRALSGDVASESLSATPECHAREEGSGARDARWAPDGIPRPEGRPNGGRSVASPLREAPACPDGPRGTTISFFSALKGIPPPVAYHPTHTHALRRSPTRADGTGPVLIVGHSACFLRGKLPHPSNFPGAGVPHIFSTRPADQFTSRFNNFTGLHLTLPSLSQSVKPPFDPVIYALFPKPPDAGSVLACGLWRFRTGVSAVRARLDVALEDRQVA